MLNPTVTISTQDEPFWIRMSVLEVRAQAEFARMAYVNIAEKPDANREWATFSSIHSFLSHCAMISKMLKASGPTRTIAQVLDVSSNSVINQRTFRNHLEHYDERLKQWINQAGRGSAIVNHHVADRTTFPVQDALFVNFYDPLTRKFTFVNEEFDLKVLYEESQAIKEKAEDWLRTQDWEPITSYA